MTHIKLFAQRVLSQMSYDDDAELLLVVKTKYPKEYRCVLDISEEIKSGTTTTLIQANFCI